MEIEQADLDLAVDHGHLTQEQAEQLWQFWLTQKSATDFQNRTTSPTANSVRFDVANVAYYFGALIVIAAMGFLATIAWETLGGWGIFGIAVIYGVVLTLVGHWLFFQQNLPIPGGLLITVAVWMTPLAIYGLQRGFGFWQQGDPGIYQNFYTWIKGSWFLMEVGTIAMSLLALKIYRFPFLTFPLAFCWWYLSMDIAPLLYGADVEFRTRALVTLWFGIICLAIAYIIDLRCRRTGGDYAFWLYLFGLMSFWFSLPFTGEDTEWHRLLYCLINLALMACSMILKRRLFMVFGGIGVFGYLSYLAFQVFADSLLFPFILSGLGLAIIAGGVVYQRRFRQLEAYFADLIPSTWQVLLPKDR